jgi:hypothetical protein
LGILIYYFIIKCLYKIIIFYNASLMELDSESAFLSNFEMLNQARLPDGQVQHDSCVTSVNY